MKSYKVAFWGTVVPAMATLPVWAGVPVLVFCEVLGVHPSVTATVMVIAAVLPDACFYVVFRRSASRPRGELSVQRLAEDVAFRTKPRLRTLGILAAVTALAFLAGGFAASKLGNITVVPAAGALLATAIVGLRILWDQLILQVAAYRSQIPPDRMKALYKDGQSLALTYGARFAYNYYCAVQGDVCYKTLVHRGKRSCFIAYPFVEPIEPLVRQMADLLESRKFDVVRAMDTAQDNILTCKICSQILSCQAFLAEGSLPNRNVFFEYGYAKGVGKPAWLLVHQRYRRNPLLQGAFGDKVQLRYGDATDAVDAILREYDEKLNASSEEAAIIERAVAPDGFVPAARIRRVLVITPDAVGRWVEVGPVGVEPIIAEAARRLEGLAVEVDLGAAMSGHPISSYTLAIARANLVVGALAAGEDDMREAYNCAVCYFLGIAVAARRRVLLLQQVPVTRPMIDLRAITRPVKSSAEVGLVVEEAVGYQDPEWGKRRDGNGAR